MDLFNIFTQRKDRLLCLSFLILLFSSTIVHAQSSILEGKVVDESWKSLPFASVILLSEKDSSIVAYSSTNELGLFSISTPQLPTILEVRFLGYKAYKALVSKPDFLNIRLAPNPEMLKEVVIEHDRPMQSSGDTITYNADSYSDSTEANVEDLLKKLPGVSVSEDGTIMAKGKEIDKILLEGDDLTGKNYRMISRNLSAQLIDKIQILDHHSDNPLLKDVEDSEKIVLNLTIKDGAKKPVFGNASVGYGTDKRHGMKANLLSVGKKLKMFALASGNNIGSNPLGTEISLMNVNQFESQLLPVPIARPIFDNRIVSRPPIAEKYTNRNSSKLVSNSIILKPSEKYKVKLVGYVTKDKFWFNQSSSSIFTQENIVLNEEIRSSEDINTYYAHLNIDRVLNRKNTLNYQGSYQRKNGNSLGEITLNENQIINLLSEKSDFHKHIFSHTKKTGKHSALLSEWQFSNSTLSSLSNPSRKIALSTKI